MSIASEMTANELYAALLEEMRDEYLVEFFRKSKEGLSLIRADRDVVRSYPVAWVRRIAEILRENGQPLPVLENTLKVGSSRQLVIKELIEAIYDRLPQG